MKRVISVVGLLALASCADLDTSAPSYSRANSTEEDLQRDLASCRMQTAMLPGRSAPYPNPAPYDPGAVGQAIANGAQSLSNAEAQESFFGDCMRSKGWVQTNG
ncbi:MAG TPA: hypothetical protein VHX61_14600 [Rhizomicrobium sp.]|jgi:hypothetical protein|nr:hypothetical protein [Rhizomicrobium sp.]